MMHGKGPTKQSGRKGSGSSWDGLPSPMVADLASRFPSRSCTLFGPFSAGAITGGSTVSSLLLAPLLSFVFIQLRGVRRTLLRTRTLRRLIAGFPRDFVNILSAETLVGIFATFLNGLFGRQSRDQRVASIADQIGSSRFAKGVANFKVVLRFEELHQCPLHLSFAQSFGNVDRLLGEWIDPRVVDAGGHIERSRNEVLDLIRFVSVLFEKYSQFDHGVEVARWVRCDEVGNEVLLLARFGRLIGKDFGEVLEVVIGWLAHLEEYIGVDVFGATFK